MKPLGEARVAVVHEWMVRYADNEQVIAVLEALPGADLYATVHDPEGLRGTLLDEGPVCPPLSSPCPGAGRGTSRICLSCRWVVQLDLRYCGLTVASSHVAVKSVLPMPISST